MRCDALSALSTVGKCALLHYLMCEACCEPAKHEVGGTTLVILLFLAFLLHLLCPFTASFHKPYYTPTYVWKFLVVSKTPAAINIGLHPQRVLKAKEKRSGSFMWHLVSVQRKGKVWESMHGYWWWQSRYARLSMLHEAGFKWSGPPSWVPPCSGLSMCLLKCNGLLNGPQFDVKR